MITRLNLSTIEQGLPKYRSMLAGNNAYNPTAYESIATFTATGTEQNFTFTSIPSTYQHLQIRVRYSCPSSGGSALDMQLNSITTGYARHEIGGDGASATAAGQINQTSIQPYDVAPSNANYAVGIIDILDYASTTKNKTVRSVFGSDRNGTGKILLASGLVQTTSAITSIYFDLPSTNVFSPESSFALYGIKGA